MRRLAAALAASAAIVGMPLPARADVAAECALAAEKGQVERDRGHLMQSRDVFVTCSRRECPQTIRKDCAEWLEDVARRLPSAAFAIRDAKGADIADAIVEVDGAAVPEAASGRAISFDPGVHAVVVRSARHPTLRSSFVLREGERSRVVPVTLDATGSSGPSGPSQPPAASAEAPPRFSIAWPIATGALAVTGGIVFSSLYFSALSRRDELAATCRGQCAQADVDAITEKNSIAVVALTIGITAAVATVVLLAVRHPSPSTSALTNLTTRGIVFD